MGCGAVENNSAKGLKSWVKAEKHPLNKKKTIKNGLFIMRELMLLIWQYNPVN